jgi:hypothetical protein
MRHLIYQGVYKFAVTRNTSSIVVSPDRDFRNTILDHRHHAFAARERRQSALGRAADRGMLYLGPNATTIFDS